MHYFQAIAKMRAYGQLPNARAADTVAPARLVPHAVAIDCVEWVQHSSCVRNDGCPFRHPPPVARVPCRHWIRSKGECWYGQHCNFLHPGSAISGEKHASTDSKPATVDTIEDNHRNSLSTGNPSTDNLLAVDSASTLNIAVSSPRKTPTKEMHPTRTASEDSDAGADIENAKSPVPDSDSSSNDSNCGDTFGSGLSLDDLPPQFVDQHHHHPQPFQWGTPPQQHYPLHHHHTSQPWPMRGRAPVEVSGSSPVLHPNNPRGYLGGHHGGYDQHDHRHMHPHMPTRADGRPVPPAAASPVSVGSPWSASHHVFVSSSAIPTAASPQSQRRHTAMPPSAVVVRDARLPVAP